MTYAGRIFFWTAAGMAVIFNLLATMALSCSGPMVAGALANASAGGCMEFWLNRYQTLLAGTAALIGAMITVRAMMRQTEMGRADDADRRLARYAGAILNLMERHTEAESTDSLEQDAAFIKNVNVASEDTAIREAMIDGAMGEDSKMLAFFVNACRMSALAKVHEHPDPRHENMVWPIYMALTNGIIKRQSILRSGGKVVDLHSLSTINQAEVQAAFLEERIPILD
jgi:hypothetical protein